MGSPRAPSNWRSKKFSKLMANRTKRANEALDAGFAGFAMPSKLRSYGDPEGSRVGQEGIDLVVLERRIESDLVIALVREICAPDFSRPFPVRRAEAESGIQQSIASLEFLRIKIRARVVR